MRGADLTDRLSGHVTVTAYQGGWKCKYMRGADLTDRLSGHVTVTAYQGGWKCKYMRGADLTQTDCQVMLLLQHIRVAGNVST